LMPALSYQYVRPDRPRFDVRRTPSNVGVVPEHFRTRHGTRRSLHPTHSVCGSGALADQMLGEHVLDSTPCGPHSPFRRVCEAGGQIVFLGCGLRPNTSMHGVEERVEPPYLFAGSATFELVQEEGRSRTMECRLHGFRGWRQRYDRIADLMESGALRTGRVLEATVHVLDAQRMWAEAETALRRDPFCFVEAAES